jgi:hypothetical protein
MAKAWRLETAGAAWQARSCSTSDPAMILRSTVRIRTVPQRVFDFFRSMDANYRAWHPDHVLFRWLGDGRLREGAEFYFEERIGGELLKKRVRFTRIEPGRLMEFAPTAWWFRLFLPSIRFVVMPDAEGCRVEQEIRVRVGPLGRRLARRQFEAVQRHMDEEGENMKRLLEDEA